MKTSTKIIIALLIIVLALAGWKYYNDNKSTPGSVDTPPTSVKEPVVTDTKKPVIKTDPIDVAITGEN
jgi:hypothetical protein|tara:strand:+ start:61 stop:264 length:204 start_codon:yes stop_codon:yes gene_type:complete